MQCFINNYKLHMKKNKWNVYTVGHLKQEATSLSGVFFLQKVRKRKRHAVCLLRTLLSCYVQMSSSVFIFIHQLYRALVNTYLH